MQSKWQVKDLVDLEYFLGHVPDGFSDSESPAGGLSAERRLYLAYEKTHQPPFSRRDLIRYWLDEKRKTAGAGQLPGDAYNETISLLRSMIIAAALFSGAALAWSVLSYSGAAPINIFTCIWVLIIPQFILLAVLGVSMTVSRLGLPQPFKGLYPLLSAVISRLLRRAKMAGESSLPGSRRLQAYAMAGFIGRQKTLYGPVFFWPVFIIAQVFGLCFNIGLLSATLLKLSITDLAFGWQSTLHPDPEIVYRLVKAFSLPWSWMSSAHPSIAQIQGSQMILKDGMIHLATPDLVSWWPFLCFSLLFYGLIPRLLLLITGIRQQHSALGRVSFSTGACDRLIQRMQTPRIRSAGRAYASPHTEKTFTGSPDRAMIPAEPRPAAMVLDPALLLVPEEIDGQLDDAELKERISHILGLKVISRIRIDMDPSTDMAALEAAVSRSGLPPAGLRVIIMIEAWQPPIRETLSWLTRLRNTVEKETGLIVALIGKPANGMLFTSPDNTDRVIWEQAVNRMGDPFIRIENLGGC